MSLSWGLGGVVAGAVAAVVLRSTMTVATSVEPAVADAVGPPPADAGRPAIAEVDVAAGQRVAAAVEVTTEVLAPDVDPAFGVIGFGRVTNPDGRGLRATVVLEGEDADRRSIRTGEDGGWSALDLVPGPQRFEVTAPGHLPQRASAQVPAASHWRRDVVLETALSIPVRFETPDGDPLTAGLDASLARGLSVVATEGSPPAVLPGVGSSRVSRYGVGSYLARADRRAPADLGSRYHGLLQLEAAPPVAVSVVVFDVVVTSTTVDGDREELVFSLDPERLRELYGELRVRVIDASSGAPIEQLALEYPSGGRGIPGELEAGQFVFRDVPPGRMDLRGSVYSRTHEFLEREIHMPPAGRLDLGTIALGPTVEATIRTVDVDGAPIELSVSAVRPELTAGPHDYSQRIGSRPDAEGRTVLTWLGAGRALVRAGNRDGWAAVAREVELRDGLELELRVPRGVEVVLADPLEPSETYAVEDAEGVPLISGRRLEREVLLAPGAYSFVVFDGGGGVQRTPFRVGEERTVVRRSGQ